METILPAAAFFLLEKTMASQHGVVKKRKKKEKKIPLCQELCHLLSNLPEQSEILLVPERFLNPGDEFQSTKDRKKRSQQ